jgi:hypothetical protein
MHYTLKATSLHRNYELPDSPDNLMKAAISLKKTDAKLLLLPDFDHGALSSQSVSKGSSSATLSLRTNLEIEGA